MVLAFKKGDTTAFQVAVQEYIDEERRRNHPVVARDLERILRNGHSRSSTMQRSRSRLGTTERSSSRRWGTRSPGSRERQLDEGRHAKSSATNRGAFPSRTTIA